MKALDFIKWINGSPRKPTQASFVFLDNSPWGRTSGVVASGWHTRNGWRVEWHAPDGPLVVFGRVTLQSWPDVTAMLRLGPVEAANRINLAIYKAAETLGFKVAAMGPT